MPEKTLNIGKHECKIIYHIDSGTPVVFLHGFSYSGDIWQKLTVTDFLKENKISFLLLNMPYGAKSDCQPKTKDIEVNLNVARESILSIFGLATPVLVGSSLGGFVGLNYAARYPVKGLLLNSPVRTQNENLLPKYHTFNFPVTIIRGTRDIVVSKEEMETLVSKLPNSELKTYESAGHSAYAKYPNKFKQDLLELYRKAS
jgi:pimeloyl-ACP methyl ester carboxylesterase